MQILLKAKVKAKAKAKARAKARAKAKSKSETQTQTQNAVGPHPGQGGGPYRPESLITPQHLALRQRLLPLLRAEEVLIQRLIPVAAATGTSLREIENPHGGPRSRSGTVTTNGVGLPTTPATGSGSGGGGGGGGSGSGSITPTQTNGYGMEGVALPAAKSAGGAPRELSVFAGSAWKTAFTRILRPGAANGANGAGGGAGGVGSGSGMGEDGIDWEDPSDPTRVLAACGQDLMRLWTDENVRTLLRVMKIRLEEMPGL